MQLVDLFLLWFLYWFSFWRFRFGIFVLIFQVKDGFNDVLVEKCSRHFDKWFFFLSNFYQNFQIVVYLYFEVLTCPKENTVFKFVFFKMLVNLLLVRFSIDLLSLRRSNFFPVIYLIIINYWRVCFFKWFTWFIFRLRTTKFRCVWIDFCSINVWSIGELIDFFVWFVFSRLGDFVLEKLSDACALNATRRSLEEYQSELKQFGDISAYYIATSRRTKNIYASLSFMPLSQYSKCAKIICV